MKRKLIGGRGDETSWGEQISPRRLVYGSDCGVEAIAEDVEMWKKSLDELRISKNDQELIFFKNVAKILKVD